MSRIFYADTSALVKLLAREEETAALREWIQEEDKLLIGSDLLRVELMRAVRRTYPEEATLVRDVLDSLMLVPISSDICDAAARLDPGTLGSLDAIHLATALTVGDGLEGILVYDDRLAEAAARYGLRVIAPGVPTG